MKLSDLFTIQMFADDQVTDITDKVLDIQFRGDDRRFPASPLVESTREVDITHVEITLATVLDYRPVEHIITIFDRTVVIMSLRVEGLLIDRQSATTEVGCRIVTNRCSDNTGDLRGADAV